MRKLTESEASALREQPFRTCSKCGSTKPREEFSPRPERPSGYCPQCKLCRAAASAAYKKRHPDKIADYKHRVASDDPGRSARYAAKYRKENSHLVRRREKARRDSIREELRQRERDRYRERRTEVIATKAKWRQKNAAKLREKSRLRRMADPEKARARSREDARRYRSTMRGRLENVVRNGVVRGLRKGAKKGRTFDILGFSPRDLMAHLEANFLPGMSWDNYGRDGWHIDHVIPLSKFNYKSPSDIDFSRAWALSNLRPLWAAENRAKYNKLTAPLQPSLAFYQ